VVTTIPANSNTRTWEEPGQGQGPPRKINLKADLVYLRRLVRYLKPYRGRLLIGVIAGVACGAISGFFPKAIQMVFHRLFETGQSPPLWIVVTICSAVPVYFALRGILGFLNNYLLTWVGSHALRDIRLQLFTHLQRMSMDFFVRTRVASLIQHVSGDTATMRESMVNLAVDVVRQPITLISAICVIGYINPWFSLVALLLGIICLVPIIYFGRKVRKYSREERKLARIALGALHETFTNVRVIKAYLLEPRQNAHFDGVINRQIRRQLQIKRQREFLSSLIELIASLGIMAAVLYVYVTKTKFSDFLGIVTGFYLMYEPLKKLAGLHQESQQALAACERVFHLMDGLPTVQDADGALELKQFRREIRFENVSLVYARNRPAVQNVNLVIPVGTVCALVGPSGAGKSSLVNLLLRFYDPTNGRVLIDGQDLHEVQMRSLRRLIGLVTQETLLFADTVATNIGLGRPDASQQEIVEAARRANAHEFIMTMPQGYETVLGERGQNLSGGQQQRIAIARAILKDPAILVLDEATSALDSESEQLVQKALAELMRGRTVIVIAHRLSTVRHADQVAVLDEGRIVELGPHRELIERDGLYKRLYDLQLLPA